MTKEEALAAEINGHHELGGSLAFWGKPFGRPHDNYHRPVAARLEAARLVITFDNQERLSLAKISGFEITENRLLIRSAALVRWEW